MCHSCNPYCICPNCPDEDNAYCHWCGHWIYRTSAAPEASEDPGTRSCPAKCPLCDEPCVGGGGPHIYHACSNGHAWEVRAGHEKVALGPEASLPPT